MKSINAIVITLIALSFVARATFFTVPEGSQAVVLRFGKPVRDPIATAGLYFKFPFVEEVRFLERRTLIWDGEPNEVPTKDQKFILVDATARWRIKDPLRFISTVIDERLALPRISSVMISATRDTISGHNLVEAVRTSNDIFDFTRSQVASARSDAALQGTDLISIVGEEKLTRDLERVAVGREKLTKKIADRARKDLEGFGIELIDVQLMRVSYNPTVEQQVYNRMKAEQDQIAGQIRSRGRAEQEAIKGKLERDLKEIQSTAYRKVQETKGGADAEATRIYAEAIGSNKQFYEFLRTAEAYRGGLRNDTRLILSTNSEFLRLLNEGAASIGSPNIPREP